MSAVGHCADNAAGEGVFGVLKRERINYRQYRTRDEAKADVFDRVERFYIQECDVDLLIKKAGLRLYQTVRDNGVKPYRRLYTEVGIQLNVHRLKGS